MVRVQNEQHLDGTREDRIGLVLRLAHPGDHGEEILRVRQVIVRIDERQPLVVAVDERGQGGQLREQPDDRDVALLGVEDVLRLGVERRQRRDAAAQHRHRMRVVAEPLEKPFDVLVHVRVERDVVHPVVVLGLVRQLAVPQQPRDFEVAGLLGQLLDRVSAIAENPLVAVNEGDRAPTRCRVS